MKLTEIILMEKDIYDLNIEVSSKVQLTET